MLISHFPWSRDDGFFVSSEGEMSFFKSNNSMTSYSVFASTLCLSGLKINLDYLEMMISWNNLDIVVFPLNIIGNKAFEQLTF